MLLECQHSGNQDECFEVTEAVLSTNFSILTSKQSALGKANTILLISSPYQVIEDHLACEVNVLPAVPCLLELPSPCKWLRMSFDQQEII